MLIFARFYTIFWAITLDNFLNDSEPKGKQRRECIIMHIIMNIFFLLEFVFI